MQIAAHVNAFRTVFSGGGDLITSNLVKSSILNCTPPIYQLYKNNLESIDLYRAWFAANQSQNRIKLHFGPSPSAISGLPAEIRDYALSAHYAGGTLVDVNVVAQNAETVMLKNVGLRIFDVNKPIPSPVPGDRPIHHIALSQNGIVDFDILKDFLLADDGFVVYDKFINNEGLDFLKYLRKTIPQNSTLKIFTTSLGNGTLTAAQIQSRVRAAAAGVNPAKTECHVVNSAFSRLTHDRYLFCGNRLHIIFTIGIKCFGTFKGARKNYLSDIDIFLADQSNPINFEYGTQIHTCFLR